MLRRGETDVSLTVQCQQAWINVAHRPGTPGAHREGHCPKAVVPVISLARKSSLLTFHLADAALLGMEAAEVESQRFGK